MSGLEKGRGQLPSFLRAPPRPAVCTQTGAQELRPQAPLAMNEEPSLLRSSAPGGQDRARLDRPRVRCEQKEPPPMGVQSYLNEHVQEHSSGPGLQGQRLWQRSEFGLSYKVNSDVQTETSLQRHPPLQPPVFPVFTRHVTLPFTQNCLNHHGILNHCL